MPDDLSRRDLLVSGGTDSFPEKVESTWKLGRDGKEWEEKAKRGSFGCLFKDF